MASRDDIDQLATTLLVEHGDRFDALRDHMFRLIDATTADEHPQTTEPLALLSPVRDGVLCVFSCVCVAATDGQPITVIATRLSAVDREEAEVAPTDVEALAFARALLGESWFQQSFREISELTDPSRASRGVRLYLSGDFQPGLPAVLGDSLIPTVETLD
ncbi:hypothetical protein [Leifsonia poae]|uniref:Uncharacterized protein n=1 Tax=Leifsonia poae TaxID=110933 RepID=A0A9W6H7E2_9MICO|nr:hypothetical protein [Leifsonia poae]GLJ74648.1 hypothetical protein GCM10017584_02210 [Leifsonia poae]